MPVGMKALLTGVISLAALLSLAEWSGVIVTGPGNASPAAKTTSVAPAIPVITGTVKSEDVPLVLTAIGTIQAYNSVLIRARVDGEITRIHFIEGHDVQAGDTLVEIDPRPFQAALEMARATKSKDEAQLANSRLDLSRYVRLNTNIPQQTVDTQEANVRALEAAVLGDQAAIDMAETQLGYATIKAPIAGRTGMRLVDQGNMVRAADGTGLLTIAQMQPIAVLFTLPQEHLGELQDAMEGGSVQVSALERDGKTLLDTGTLVLIDNAIDPATGALRLKASFPNSNRRLWPGQFVNVGVRIRVLKTVAIAEEAIQRGPDGFFVYVVKPDQTVETRTVKTGQIYGDTAVVSAGLTAGETIVLEGQYKLRNGARIKDVGRQCKAGTRPAVKEDCPEAPVAENE